MNKIRKNKLMVFLTFAIGLSIAFTLIIFSLRQNLNVFVTPKDLVAMDKNKTTAFRLGGMVKEGSVKSDRNKKFVAFVVTDFHKDIQVIYNGLLPDLFREGKGVIAEGYLMNDGRFKASLVLAKHDENYMPKSAYVALKEEKA